MEHTEGLAYFGENLIHIIYWERVNLTLLLLESITLSNEQFVRQHRNHILLIPKKNGVNVFY